MVKAAREQAMTDIMEDLHRNGKSFLSFRKDLNPVMNKLEDEYLSLQESVKRK